MMMGGTTERFTDLLLSMSLPNGESNWDWFPDNPSGEYHTSAISSQPTSSSDTSGFGGDSSPGVFREGTKSTNQSSCDLAFDHSPEQADPLPHDFQRSISPDSPIQTPCSSPLSPRPWKRRLRRGEIPDSREPSSGRKSALESAIRICTERSSDAVIAPEIGIEFDSLPEAYDFYNLYSWEIGFGIRYGPSNRNSSGSKTVQDITCGCEGRPMIS